MKIIKYIILISIIIVSSICANAQSSKYERFSDDTITDADTLIFTLADYLDGEDLSSWQVKGTNLSGTTAFTVYKQQSNTVAGDIWTTIQSWTATDTVITAVPSGKRERLYIISTGTQSTVLNVANVLTDNR